eukprot:jgi/Botrbrau1/8548/Bobra.0359s0012.1
MSGNALSRLLQERKQWRKEHPFGFIAKPDSAADGSVNFFQWHCKIPGREGTIWEGGLYPVTLTFPESYPTAPPHCKFPSGFFHPNVFDSGTICISITKPSHPSPAAVCWRPSITLAQLLVAIQDLLNDPYNADPAQDLAYRIYKNNRTKYERLVKEQAKKYAADDAGAAA